MKRQHPFFTLLGMALTVILFAGLAFSLWSSGGKAFSPGSLSEKSRPGIFLGGYSSHAEFEKRCKLCHAPLDTPQVELCLACHTHITEEITAETGAHGSIENADQCADCHTDHHGRDFDITQSAHPHFAHENTNFSLNWHQVDYDAEPIDCGACHMDENGFAFSDSSCMNCHAGWDTALMRQHAQSHSDACLLCHDGQDRMMSFNHQDTGFSIDGIHGEIDCVACHKLGEVAAHDGRPSDNTFLHPPTRCTDCHAEPEIHRGLFDAACEQCHTTASWLPAKLESVNFDHAITTGFSLVRHQKDTYDQPLNCASCHSQDLTSFNVQRCITCHAGIENGLVFMEEHQAQYGHACLQCHDGSDRMSNFDHTRVFPLEGQHTGLECEQCHPGKQFAGTPSACVECHAEPEIHTGFFGWQCQYCHTVDAWRPASLRLHIFPLDHGGQGEIACQVCHPSSYAQHTCYTCHEHQPDPITASHLQAGITLEQIPNCVGCHTTGEINPNDG